MIAYELLYIAFCLILANINAHLIKDGKKIYHWANGLLHLTSAFIFSLLYWWPGAIIILCNSRLFFDLLLNIFRGLPIDYVPVKPKSWIDKAEKWIFGKNGILPKVIYLIVSISLNAYYFLK